MSLPAHTGAGATARALLLLAAGLTSAPAIAAETQPSLIAFEMQSWGRTLSSWTIGPDGSGSWLEAKPNEPIMVVHEIASGADKYQQLLRILDALPVQAPDSEGCTNFMTDQPYGKLRITRGATTTEIAWNAGCMDEPYARFLGTLRAANEMVQAWGKQGKVLREEQVRP